jgi:hypothetical protein
MDGATRGNHERAGARADRVPLDPELELALEDVERVRVVRMVVRLSRLGPWLERVLAHHQVVERREQRGAPELLGALPALDVHVHRLVPPELQGGQTSSCGATRSPKSSSCSIGSPTGHRNSRCTPASA